MNKDGNITNSVKYQVIDTQRLVILGTFDTPEGAEIFLINNPMYRRPEIKTIPTLTHKDIKSLSHIMRCMSEIYEEDNKAWFDNKIVNKIVRDFIEKIDDIQSSKSVEDYIQ